MDQQTPIDPKDTIEWLNKLIMVAQWDKKLSFYTVRLVADPAAYQEFLTRVRASSNDKTQLADNSTDDTPIAVARRKLLAAVASVPSLQELFGSDHDPFNGAPPDHLQLLTEVSDITTDPQKMVYSMNGTLLAVIEALRQSQELDPEALIVDGLNKFFTLIETNKPVAEMLFKLAGSPHWFIVLASLRDDRDYTRDEDDPAVADTLKTWQAKLTTELRALLFKPGHLSRAPKKLIKMGWNERWLFDEAREAIPADAREQDVFEERRQVAEAALLLFEEEARQEYEEIKADLNVLAVVARHFINVRKFAKLDGFVYTWPEIARLAMANYPALEYVEDLLVNRKPKPTETDLDAMEARELYALCEKNDRLVRFLRLRPYFREIDDDELRRYRPLAPVVITDTVPPAPGESARTADFTPQQPPTPSPPPVSTKRFQIRYVEIEKVADAVGFEEGAKYRVASYPPETLVREFPDITLSVEKLLEQIRTSMGVTSDGALQENLAELFSTAAGAAEQRMNRGGTVLVTRLLPINAREEIYSLLSRGEALRVIVKSTEREVHYLPWEWWPGVGPTVFLNSPEHSLVRGSAATTEAISIIAPLRVLSIIPDSPTGRRFTSDVTVERLESVFAREPARYTGLIRTDATLENVRHELDTLQPHVVHFEGYVNPATTTLRILFSKPDDDGIPIEKFGVMLKDKGVQLLVIGRNSSSRIFENFGATLAFLLSRQGLPAVIAPIRSIDDMSATTFTTEFYRAFLQGKTLEAALHLARSNLASKGGDWSVFALFADPSHLDYFQLLRETA